MSGWYGVDLDGTLAEYHGWPSDGSIGKPIPAMVERVKQWLATGVEVRIFTARMWPLGTAGVDGHTVISDVDREDRIKQVLQIERWCKEHIGVELPVTCVKDFGMICLYDDRCVQVEANTGRLIEEPCNVAGIGRQTR